MYGYFHYRPGKLERFSKTVKNGAFSQTPRPQCAVLRWRYGAAGIISWRGTITIGIIVKSKAIRASWLGVAGLAWRRNKENASCLLAQLLRSNEREMGPAYGV